MQNGDTRDWSIACLSHGNFDVVLLKILYKVCKENMCKLLAHVAMISWNMVNLPHEAKSRLAKRVDGGLCRKKPRNR